LASIGSEMKGSCDVPSCSVAPLFIKGGGLKL
jgi:hypothetical protein